MKFFYRITDFSFFFCFGGLSYYFIEIMYRGYSHYSMFLCGGLIFYFLSLLERRWDRFYPFLVRMLFAALIITVVELIFGIIFNLILHKHVWDYSDQPFHLKGQICPAFSILWFFLSAPVLLLEKWVRKELVNPDIFG